MRRQCSIIHSRKAKAGLCLNSTLVFYFVSYLPFLLFYSYFLKSIHPCEFQESFTKLAVGTVFEMVLTKQRCKKGQHGRRSFQSCPCGDSQYHSTSELKQNLIQFSIYFFLELARPPWVIRPGLTPHYTTSSRLIRPARVRTWV